MDMRLLPRAGTTRPLSFCRLVLIVFSHIFCVDCASRLKLSNPPEGQRPVCPACDTHLNNPDDAVITNLIPTEDYKTSVLSGLSPNIIMECAGRALSFWAYQTTQEMYVAVTSLIPISIDATIKEFIRSFLPNL
jgi:hypothetical protein